MVAVSASGSWKERATQTQTPNSRALIVTTPAKRTPPFFGVPLINKEHTIQGSQKGSATRGLQNTRLHAYYRITEPFVADRHLGTPDTVLGSIVCGFTLLLCSPLRVLHVIACRTALRHFLKDQTTFNRLYLVHTPYWDYNGIWYIWLQIYG